MRGTDLTGPDGPVDDGSDEEELRILLHRAVPALEAPDDRMDRVLARVARARCRRRAVALAAGLTAGLTAAVLATAPALAPAPGRGTGLGPAAAAPAPVSPTATPVPAPTPTPTPVTFPMFPEMTVDVPAGWHSWAAPATDPQKRFGYLGTRPQVSSCATPVCPSSGALLGGDVILVFRLLEGQELVDKVSRTTPGLTDSTAEEDCVIRGGTRELVGVRAVNGADRKAVVEVTACLRQPSEATLAKVRQVFGSVRPAPASPLPPDAPPADTPPADDAAG
ncbi:hypothetical protein ACFRMQ_34860 [Kitasatospora sp. NPDC056783]|uniref:hypothetical protein n=1 Tax=Kitasatospora sp. NPDC056783 TaxID=3345943 RepID=UPI0036BE0BAB